MKLPKSRKQRIREQQELCFAEMSKEGITTEDWKELNNKYEAYSAMLKKSWRVSPDALLMFVGNLIGIVLVLNFEKIDIVRSKAFGMIPKGKV